MHQYDDDDLSLLLMMLLNKDNQSQILPCTYSLCTKACRNRKQFADNEKLLLIIKIGNRSNAADT